MATNIVGANLTDGGSFIDLMKRLQPQREIKRLWELQYPLLGKVSKANDFDGTQIDVPLEHDHPSRSRDFATAQGNNRFPSSSVKYSLTRAKDYSTGRLDAETMHASRNDRGSWLRSLQREQSNTVKALQKNTAISLYRNHGGSIGKMASVSDAGGGTNDTLVLENKSDVINFSRGMSLVFSVADGTSGALLAQTAATYVRKVDFDAGTIQIGASDTTTQNYATNMTGESETEYIFNEGDWGASFRGLESWIPLTTPSSGEDFLGIDRSVDPMRLAGHRLNDTSMSYEEIVQELAARIVYSGGGNLVCMMSPIQVKQFALELDTKVTRDPGGMGKTGFRGIAVDTVAGTVEVLGDPACPENRCFMLDMSSWKFHHLLALPHLVEDDGLSRVRVSDADQIEFRYRLWGNLACTAPGKNAVAALPTAF